VICFDNHDAGCSTHFSHCAPPDFRTLAVALEAGQRVEVPYTLHDMAADAIGLLDALSIRRAHVVGRSMGGLIAQVLASEYPERIASLTSIMSTTGNAALPQTTPDLITMMMAPAPDPTSDEARFLAHSLAFARRIAPARPIRSTTPPIVASPWKRSVGPMTLPASDARWPRSPWPATAERGWRR
jgi:pimeloyl-ACP methyl ester carboxylesterase